MYKNELLSTQQKKSITKSKKKKKKTINKKKLSIYLENKEAIQ